MKENSIEEDIKIIENLKEAINSGLCYFGSVTMYDCGYQEALNHILSDYKRVLKENEELKNKLNLKHFDINVVYNDYLEKLNEYKENSIPVQKVKDKIEEILNNGEYRIIFEGDAEFPDEATCIDAQKYIKLEKLQELLEGRK